MEMIFFMIKHDTTVSIQKGKHKPKSLTLQKLTPNITSLILMKKRKKEKERKKKRRLIIATTWFECNNVTRSTF